jgi:hypothetical protein
LIRFPFRLTIQQRQAARFACKIREFVEQVQWRAVREAAICRYATTAAMQRPEQSFDDVQVETATRVQSAPSQLRKGSKNTWACLIGEKGRESDLSQVRSAIESVWGKDWVTKIVACETGNQRSQYQFTCPGV